MYLGFFNVFVRSLKKMDGSDNEFKVHKSYKENVHGWCLGVQLYLS